MTPEATTVRIDNPSYQAYQILHIAFAFAPIVAGADKFFHFLTNWEMYVAPAIPRMLGISAHMFMLAVGAIEIHIDVVAGMSWEEFVSTRVLKPLEMDPSQAHFDFGNFGITFSRSQFSHALAGV